MNTETMILTRSEVARLLSPKESMQAVEEAFRLFGTGKTLPPGILGVHARDGGFHIKAGIMDLARPYFVAKMNANFPGNPKKYGIPTIQGVIIVADATNGRLLALTDSIEITIQRTGAATAVAAKYLAKQDSTRLAVIGCGNQGRVTIEMLAAIFPLTYISLFDTDKNAAQKLQEEIVNRFSINVEVVGDPADAVINKDIVVTCTTSKKPLLGANMISPGTFIAAVGADNEDKQELDVQLVRQSTLVTDVTDQCATIGELHHALESGLVTRGDVHAQLGDVVAGSKAGRTSTEEVIVFDSTGMALQDVACAAIVYERALEDNGFLVANFQG